MAYFKTAEYPDVVYYDFEVFARDWLVVLVDGEGHERRIHNDAEALVAYVDAHAGSVWIGYNSINYDRWILAAILSGWEPDGVKWLSDALIFGSGGTPWQRCKSAKINLNCIKDNLNAVAQYDAIYKVNSIPRGLKACEGHAGLSIFESGVDFDLYRRLTAEEVEETFEYCAYDVAQTIAIFKASTHAEFDTKVYFIEKYDLPLTRMSDTLGTLVDVLLEGNKGGQGLTDAGAFELPDTLRLEKYKYVQDLRESEAGREVDGSGNFRLNIEENIAGLPHVLASGGIHGAPDGAYHYKGLILSLDIAACYPSMMARYGIARRVIGRWDRFLEVHGANLNYKRSGNKAARQPFKILDNSISGRLKASFSTLYDPRSNNEICQGGIFLLLDLIEHLETGAAGIVKLIQSNTDGLYYAVLQPEHLETVRAIVAEWQERTGLMMDDTVFEGVIYQKDVNNYVIADDNGRILKSKGQDLKALSTYDYNLAIINRGLMAYLIHDTTPEETVNTCDDLRDFQLIAHAGKDDALKHNGVLLQLKTVRAFASVYGDAGALEKVHNGKTGKYPNSPACVFFDNGDVRGKAIPAELDRAWYISRIYEAIIRWTGEVTREEDRSTKAAKDAAKKARQTSAETAQAEATPAPMSDTDRSSGGKKPRGKRSDPLDPITLLDLKIEKKAFDDYAPEEVAAGVLRRLVAEYLTPNGLSLKGAKWVRQRADVWTLRIKDHGDDRYSERGLILDIHLDGGKNARLQSFRANSTVWSWQIKNDPDFKLSKVARDLIGLEPYSDEEVERMIKRSAEKKAAKEASEAEARRDRETMRKEYQEAKPLADVPVNSTAYGVQYLKSKGVFEYAQEVDPALKIHSAKGTLIAPYYTARGALYAAQQIGTNGFKAWYTGTYPRGQAVHVIRGRSRSVIAICEGLATGLSVHRRYKGLITVFVAGDANNLQAFGASFLGNESFKAVKVIVAADNDVESERKTGINKGMTVAEAVKAIAPERVTIARPEE